MHETDVVIIGAGPVGLFAIFELGMLKVKCHVVDTLDAIGGQCTALYPEKPIYDIPAHPAISGQDLITQLEAQAAPFEPTYHLGQQVTAISRHPEEGLGLTKDLPAGGTIDPSAMPQDDDASHGFTVKTSTGTSISCKAIIIAAGCGAFGPNKPPLADLDAYEKSGAVQYLVTQKDIYQGKKVVIAGGGDSAVDWANILADVAEKVYVVHRRPKFRAMDESVSQMHAKVETGKIEMVIPYQLDALLGENGHLNAVQVKTLDGETKQIEADHLLPFFGLAMELGPIAEWGLNLDRNLITVDPSTCQTSHDGIYAIGDIATYTNKLKLIACGFSEGAMAAHDIRRIIYPNDAYHFEYSTTKGVPA